MSPQAMQIMLGAVLLRDARVLSVIGENVTLDSEATGKEIFDAEAKIRLLTGVKYELFMERQQDANKLRIKLADLRGVKT